MAAIACVDDLRKQMQRASAFYDYCESGSDRVDLQRERSDLQDIKFRQRRHRGRTKHRDDHARQESRCRWRWHRPSTGMQHADGEILAAAAEESAFTLSTMSTCSIEDVAENTSKPFWFQLYVMRDLQFIRNLVERARAANCSALMITLISKSWGTPQYVRRAFGAAEADA